MLPSHRGLVLLHDRRRNLHFPILVSLVMLPSQRGRVLLHERRRNLHLLILVSLLYRETPGLKKWNWNSIFRFNLLSLSLIISYLK
jgi:hypothetical protein